MGRPLNPTNRLRAIAHPSLLDIAWAAGIVEGEGNFDGRPTTEQVNVTQKDLWLLERFQRLFGGSIWTNTRGVSRWYLTGARARGFTMTIFSFLSPRRRKQAIEMLRPLSPVTTSISEFARQEEEAAQAVVLDEYPEPSSASR